jgi:hypothetical protein
MSASYLLALQSCVGLGLLRGLAGCFVIFPGGDRQPHAQPPNLEDQGLQIFWSLPSHVCDAGALPGAYAPTSIALRVTVACKSLHDNTVVLEVDLFI